MAIIGDEIRDYVASQITIRQVIHGAGVTPVDTIKGNLSLSDYLRPDKVINVLNSNTSWVKLASGVSVAASKLTEIGVDTSLDGLGLAKRYVLNSGFSKYEETGGEGRLTQRSGILPQYADSSYTYGRYGYSPMPGIISADIKALNRGSIKKATVKIKINNKEQFNIIDLLYFRLGYTVLLEWGNSMFFNNSVEKKIVRDTLIDNPSYFFNSSFGGSESYQEILPKIESYRLKYAGNYDGLLGKISNFQWSFNKDGSYDAEITIISLGDVVESLKTNISTDKTLSNFIIQASSAGAITGTDVNDLTVNPPPTPTTIEGNEEQPDILEDNKDANSIASMLWVWKWVNRLAIGENVSSGGIYNTLSGGKSLAGAFLKTSGDSISTTQTVYEFTFIAKKGDLEGPDIPIESILPVVPDEYKPKRVSFSSDQLNDETYQKNPIKLETATVGGFTGIDVISDTQVLLRQQLGDKKSFTQEEYQQLQSVGPGGISNSDFPVEVTYEVFARGKKISGDITTTSESPIKDFNDKDAFWLNSVPTQPLYLRLGALLDFIQDNVLPRVDVGKKGTEYTLNPSIFKIDSYTSTNIMYSLPNQISLDPRVCIVEGKGFQAANGAGATPESYFEELYAFRIPEVSPNKAYMMNIYLNFNFILESLNSAADERGDTNVFTFLQNICNGINKALGGINNIEPVMDEDSNTLRLQDTTPIPGNIASPSYILQLYGYDKIGEGYISNFIRKVDLKTAITPEYATMITVGATAGGYVKGTEATAFSRWNEGLTDRFKEKFTPGNANSLPDSNGIDEAVTNYVEKMLATPAKYPLRLGFLPVSTGQTDGFGEASTDAIESNLSVGTEYFKYLIASQKNQQGGTVGFIPFKIGFTMDGLSGIKIYNKLHIDTRFLPKAYGNTLDLIVTGVSHKLAKNDWETDIEATVIPKTNELKDLVITAAVNTALIQQGVAASSTVTSPGGSNFIQGQSVIDVLNKFMDAAGIPKTTENTKFMKAWKQAETTKAKYSLFGSTQKYNNSTKFNGANVQNYNSIDDSIAAHVKTISNKYYPNLYADLKAGKKTALKIANDNLKELKTWGTGQLLITVLDGGVKDKNLKIYF